MLKAIAKFLATCNIFIAHAVLAHASLVTMVTRSTKDIDTYTNISLIFYIITIW